MIDKEKGIILTNSHCVNPNSDYVYIAANFLRKDERAKVIAKSV